MIAETLCARSYWHGLGLLVGGAVLCIALAGCSPSALQRQATMASVVRVALDSAADGIDLACARERVEESAVRLRKCSRAVEAHDVAIAAWSLHATAILLAVEDEDSALGVALALSVPAIEAYRAVAALLRELGVDAPELTILGGGS